MHLTKLLAVAIVIALAPTLVVAEVVVSYYEPLRETVVSETAKDTHSFSSKLSAPAARTMQFQALGKNFDLQLVANERIASAIQSEVAQAEIQVYRGQLANNSQSWARIVVFNGVPRGMIWDGFEMYAIEAPGDSALPIDSAVIYRMADVFVVSGTMSCGSDFLSGSAAALLKQIGTSTKVAVARAAGAVSEITLSAIGDFEFTNARGGDSAAIAAITTRLNNVDGYFSEQVGVQINVPPDAIETFSDSADPFTGSLDSGVLLDELSEYRLQTAVHNSRGLTHLWTGKDLDTTTVGVAWRGTLCEDYFGAGLSEGNGGALIDSLIAAHEIGHNFGAQHDGESGTSCASETGRFIMSPSINGSLEFSGCSIGVMQASVAAASCVTALPTVDVSVQPTVLVGNVLLGAATDFEYLVASNGTLDAAGVAVNFSIPDVLTLNAVTTSAGTCLSGAGAVDCDLGVLAGLSSASITLSVAANSLLAGTLTANVSTTNFDERQSNNQHVTQFTVEPAVDLVAGQPSSAAVFLNSVTAISIDVENLSTLGASDVTARIVLEDGLEAVSASWSIGSCTITAPLVVDCVAASLAAQTSSVISISATGTTTGNKDVTVVLAAAEAEVNPDDNSSVGIIRVVAQDDSKDDRGGGGLSPLVLLLAYFASVLSARSRLRSRV
jgi:hypothetical protein